MNNQSKAQCKQRKTQVWIDGKRTILVPQCAGCGVIPEGKEPPDDWEYVELNPYNGWGWMCRKCQDD